MNSTAVELGNLEKRHAPSDDLKDLLERAAGCYDAGRHAEGAELARQAADLAGQLGDNVSRARALRQLAVDLLRLGDYENAARAARNARDQSQRDGDLSGQSEALATLTMILSSLGLDAEALEASNTCLALARESGSAERSCWALNRCGCVQQAIENHAMAVDLLTQSLVMARKLDNRETLFATLNNLSEALIAQGQSLRRQGDPGGAMDTLRRGLRYAEESLNLARASGSVHREVMALGNVGMLQGLCEPGSREAEENLAEGARLASEHNYRPLELRIGHYQGHLLRLQGRHEQAIATFEALLAQASDTKDRGDVLQLHRELAETYKLAERYQEAVEAQEHFHRLDRARLDQIAATREKLKENRADTPAATEGATTAHPSARPARREITRDYYAHYLPMLRTAIVAGCALYTPFIILDLIYLPELISSLLLNRITVVVLALAILAATYQPIFLPRVPEFLLLLHLIVGAGTLHLGFVTPLYIPSVYCVIIFFSLIPRAELGYIALGNALLVAAYAVLSMLGGDLVSGALWFDAGLLAAAALVCQLGAYLRERSIHAEHERNTELKAASAALDAARQSLAEQFETLERRHAELEADVRLARRVQEQFMPEQFEHTPGMRVQGFYRPMTQVGGDYFDLIHRPDGSIALLIGDVSGHGVTASLITAMAKITTAVHAPEASSPADLLRRLNAALLDKTGAQHLTLFAVFVEPDRRRIRFANAGHCQPLLFRAGSDEVTTLESQGLFLGLLPSDDYEDGSINYAPGDRLILYTDGFTEARNGARELFGVARFTAALARYRQLSANNLLRRLMENLESFQERYEFDDDLAMLIADLD